MAVAVTTANAVATAVATGAAVTGAAVIRAADVAAPEVSADAIASGGRVSDLEAACSLLEGFVASFEPDRHTVASVRAVTALCSRAVNLGSAGIDLCAPRLSRAGSHRHRGSRSGVEELAAITGSSLAEARHQLSIGEASESSPGMAEALRGGRLSPERAALVAKGVGATPDAEGELLASAATESLNQLRDRQRHARARALRREEAAAREARLHAGRRARTFVDDDGYVHIDARLTPEAGALVKGALATEADALLEEAKSAGAQVPHEPRGALEADALCRLVARGEISARSSTTSGRHPAGGQGVGRSLPGPRACVTLRVDLAALRQGELRTGELCEIPGVGPVSLATARALLGDAVVTLVVGHGIDVTTVAHLGRTVPTALRRALAERDPVCVVPGCGSSWNLEVDHWRLPFAEDGAASLENCVVLCRFHHRLRHYQGFTLGGGPGQWRFDPPPGRGGTDPPATVPEPSVPSPPRSGSPAGTTRVDGGGRGRARQLARDGDDPDRGPDPTILLPLQE